MENQEQMQMNVDLKSTTALETPSGKKVFQQGVLLRKVSKFVVGASKDAIMPIPVFYDPESGKVVAETLPPDLRDEMEDDCF